MHLIEYLINMAVIRVNVVPEPSCKREMYMFKKNMGTVDRWSRLGLGLALIASAAVGALGPWAYLGIIPVITGALGNCPLYSLVGMSTCKTQK
jgi:hypothetical protein